MYAAWEHSWWLIFFVFALGVLIWTPEHRQADTEPK